MLSEYLQSAFGDQIDKSSLMINKLKMLIFILFVGCLPTEKKTGEEAVATPDHENNASTPIPDLTNKDGKELFATCVACHGEKAEGNRTLGAPSLVNQDDWYLKRQVLHFKNGIRGNDPDDTNGAQMAAIAKALPDESAVNIVVDFIKTLPPIKTIKTIDGDPSKGKTQYDMVCGACHGPAAVGIESLNSPRLVGVDDWYLAAQYNKFREGKRGNHPDDVYGAQMKMMSSILTTPEAVNDVMAYIRSLED